MTRQEALYQSLAASGSALITFMGIVHEVAGPLIFPWAPAAFGALLWHGIGVFAIVLGLLLLGGAVHVIKFPVTLWALLASVGGVVAMIVMAVANGDFHFFAMCLIIVGSAVAIFHRKAERLRATSLA